MNVEEYIVSLNLADEATEGLKKFLKDNYGQKAKFDETTQLNLILKCRLKNVINSLKH